MQKQKNLVLAIGVVLSLGARGGDSVGNGGDALSMEFIARGHQVAEYFAAHPDQTILSVDKVKAFATALESTPIVTTETQLQDCHGIAVDAHVLPCPGEPGDPRIEINRGRWQDYHFRRANVYGLVFHEYLWVIGVDDTNYKVSSALPLGNGNATPLVTLPSGVFRGAGTWRTDDGASGAYEVITTINQNHIASDYGADGVAQSFAGDWIFRAGSFIDLYADGVATPVGSGECNEVQCAYSIPSYYSQEETWTFMPEKIERFGSRVYQGAKYYWNDSVAKDAN